VDSKIDLVEYLVVKYPQHMNTSCTTAVLLDNKADVNARGHNSWTPIHYVSERSCLPATPYNIPQLLPYVSRLLLEQGADVAET
jgi:ankyrin repeat protein